MVEEKYICEFCGNSFSTKTILKTHKKSALYCLTKRSKKVQSVQKFKCKHCQKEYTTQQNLDKHLGLCKEKKKYHDKKLKSQIFTLKRKNIKLKIKNKNVKIKLIDLEKQSKSIKKELVDSKEQNKESEKEIHELKIMVEKLREENIKTREKLAKKEGVVEGIINAPIRNITNKNTTNKNTNTNTNTTTTYVNPKLTNINVENIEPLTIERIKKQISNGKFTDKHFEKGIDGIVEFLVPIMTLKRDDGTVERNYVCTDVSRNKFYRLEEGKVWKSDSGGLFIGKAINELGPSVNDSYRRLVDKKHSTDSDHMKNVYKEKIDKLMPIFRASVGNFNDEFVEVLTKTKNKMKHHISV